MKKFTFSNLMLGLVLLIIWVGSSSAFASEEYQNELRLFTYKNKQDGGDKISQAGTSFQYYFSPVSTQGKPLNEAAFLDRAGSVSVGYSNSTFDGGFDADTRIWVINTILSKKGMPWVLNLMYANQDGKITAPAKADVTGDIISLGLGYFIMDGLLISGQYMQNDTKTSGFNTFEQTAYAVRVKWLRLLTARTAFNFGLGIEAVQDKNGTVTEDGWTLRVSSDYYFTPETSTGFLYLNITHDDKNKEGSLFGLTAKHFLTPHFSVDANAGWYNADNVGNEDEKQWGLALAYRF